MREVTAQQAFERWARWRVGGVANVSAYSQMSSLTGRLLDGMRSTTCPDCRGEGRMPGHRVGSAMAFIDPCPSCNGLGRIKGDLQAKRSVSRERCEVCYDKDAERSTGEVNGRTCVHCRGRGERIHVELEVNPAAIKGTRYYGANEDPDPVSMLIDRLVVAWAMTDGSAYHAAIYRVVMAEYCCVDVRNSRVLRSGTQEAKADELNLSRRFFVRMLTDAHTRAQEALTKRNL